MSVSRVKALRQDQLNAQRRLRGEESDLQLLEDVMCDPGTHAEAAAIPKKQTGRPRDHPDYMQIVFAAAVSIYGSAHKVEAQFADPRVWDFLRDTAKAMFPDDPSQWLPPEQMKRYHFSYAKCYLADPGVLRARAEISTREGVELARSMGLGDPDGPGSFTHPDLSRLLYGDGKVFTPIYKAKPGETRVDKKTGEIHHLRFDPDASDHVEGGGDFVYGTKFAWMHIRSDLGRVILGVAHVPFSGSGGEAGVAFDLLSRIVEANPGGFQGVIYDMAMRGDHIDRIMRLLGLLTIARVPAKEKHARKGQRTGRRVPKEKLIEVRTVKGPNGVEQQVRFVAKDGALGIAGMNDKGGATWERLERLRTQRHPDKSAYRWYNQYALPAGYETREISVRLHNDDADRAKHLNRAENLRAIPPGDPDFDRLYAQRADAESINRHLEDTLYLNRAHSVGYLRQWSDMLGFARLVNAHTRARAARERERERLKAA